MFKNELQNRAKDALQESIEAFQTIPSIEPDFQVPTPSVIMRLRSPLACRVAIERQTRQKLQVKKLPSVGIPPQATSKAAAQVAAKEAAEAAEIAAKIASKKILQRARGVLKRF